MLKKRSFSLVATSLVLSPVVSNAAKTSVAVAAPWEIVSYEPSVSGFAFHRLEVLETLVDADVQGVLQPGLATAWSASSDGLSWSFDWREDVRFHDGSALSAEIAADALTRAQANPGMLKKAPIAGIAAQDGKVVITLEKLFSARCRRVYTRRVTSI